MVREDETKGGVAIRMGKFPRCQYLVVRFGSEFAFTPIKLTVSKALVSKFNVLAITFWNVLCLEGC